MPLDPAFKLDKMTIESYETVQRTAVKEILGHKSFEVMFNPETLTTRHESVVPDSEPASGHSVKPTHRRDQDLTVKLVFDGTPVGRNLEASGGRTVSQWVERFLAHCYDVDSESHEARYLTIKWGNGIMGKLGFQCRLGSVDIQYTLFDRDGSPLRAELTARFVEAMDPATAAKVMRLSSPDLTHHRIVRAGDTLPQLCREIYGSPALCLRVARFNKLDHFRDLVPGQALLFPPVGRGGRR